MPTLSHIDFRKLLTFLRVKKKYANCLQMEMAFGWQLWTKCHKKMSIFNHMHWSVNNSRNKCDIYIMRSKSIVRWRKIYKSTPIGDIFVDSSILPFFNQFLLQGSNICTRKVNFSSMSSWSLKISAKSHNKSHSSSRNGQIFVKIVVHFANWVPMVPL